MAMPFIEVFESDIVRLALGDIMRHIESMYLKFGYFVLYIPIYRLTERKKHLKKTVHAER